MTTLMEDVKFHDFEPDRQEFLMDVYNGLSQTQKALPCKYFYDELGSGLFNAICTTAEYYPTRTELSIMRTHANEMAAMIGPKCLLMEYGSGNGEKIRLLLNHLNEPIAYVPIDISKEHLKQTAEDLNRDYPRLEILAVCADFTKEFCVPAPQRNINQKVIYFPGSTIGNFNKKNVSKILLNMNNYLNHGDGLLIGIDLKKDEGVLTKAYNDHSGFTEAFNRNLLSRINNELDGNFKLNGFDHKAFYNQGEGRVEMHLVSRKNHDVIIDGQNFHFNKGESIHTESSYKYNIEEFSQIAGLANFSLKKYWVDNNNLFGVLYLAL